MDDWWRPSGTCIRGSWKEFAAAPEEEKKKMAQTGSLGEDVPGSVAISASVRSQNVISWTLCNVGLGVLTAVFQAS